MDDNNVIPVPPELNDSLETGNVAPGAIDGGVAMPMPPTMDGAADQQFAAPEISADQQPMAPEMQSEVRIDQQPMVPEMQSEVQIDQQPMVPEMQSGVQVDQQPMISEAQPVAPEVQPEVQSTAPEVQPEVQSPAPEVQPEVQQQGANFDSVNGVGGQKPGKKQTFFDKMKKIDWKKADIKTVFSALSKDDEMVSGTATTFEISLVPSVKAEAIKAIKMRNLTLFICIIVVAAAFGVVAVLGSIVTGQSIAMGNQDSKLKTMSEKVNSFNGISEYLTIQDQLGNIASIEDKQKVLSRVFPFLSVLLPSGPDNITISELNINLKDNTMSIVGQADAGTEPFIDYRVLESFKKSASLVTYDYGRYVDANGDEIPTRCMVESNSEGGTLEKDNSIYAYWLRGKTGCDKATTERDLEVAEMIESWEAEKREEEQNKEDEKKENTNDEENVGDESSKEKEEKEREELREKKKEIYDKYKDEIPENWYDKWLKENDLHRYDDDRLSEDQLKSMEAAYQEWLNSLDEEKRWVVEREVGDGMSIKNVNVRKVYRTPQFSKWYKKGYMDLSGTISDVPHFETQCIKYTGTELDDTIRWTSENDNCKLLTEPITISESSNGRDSDGNLVLRFEASAVIDEQALAFRNKNVMAIGPNGQDVTDSYVQIGGMFKEEAKDCNSGDVVCTSNKENETGGSDNAAGQGGANTEGGNGNGK